MSGVDTPKEIVSVYDMTAQNDSSKLSMRHHILF